MGHQTSDVDTESLQKNERPRGRCLDAFLVAAVIFLFVAVTALAVVGVMVAMRLQANQQPLHILEKGPEALAGDTPSPAFKMQNFAYVEAISSKLENATMKWASVKHGEGSSVQDNFEFVESQHSLMPKKTGTYFIYISVNLSCVHKCGQGTLSFKVGDKLTCDVELAAGRTSVSKKCWNVSPLTAEGLVTQMVVPKEGLENWKLILPGSGLGMFLID